MKTWTRKFCSRASALGILLSVFCSTHIFADPLTVVTVPIEHRSPDEILEALLPFKAPSDVIKVFDHQLILKGDPNTVAQLKQLIDSLDVPNSQLMMSVSQSQGAPTVDFQIDAQGHITFLEEKKSNNSRRVRSTVREDEKTLHHIKVLSGGSAFVHTGITIPMIRYVHSSDGQYQLERNAQNQSSLNQENLSLNAPATAGTTLSPQALTSVPSSTRPLVQITVPTSTQALINLPAQPNALFNVQRGFTNQSAFGQATQSEQFDVRGHSKSLDYQTLQSGIWIRPLKLKDKVYLEISATRQKAITPRGVKSPKYLSQNTQTTLVVPLGQWIYLGGVQQAPHFDKKPGWSYSTSPKTLERNHLWIRVDAY